MRHEIIINNPDVEVRFYLSKDEGSYVTPHWHNSLEIVYVLKGKVTVNLPMGKKVTARDGELFLVNPREIHSVLSEKNEALVLQIPQKLYDHFVPSMRLRWFEVDMHPQGDREKTKLMRLKKIFEDMSIVYDIQPEGYLLKFNSLLYELLYTLIHYYSVKILPKDMEKNDKYLQRVNDIMQYVAEHYRENISVSNMADHFGYNPDYLSRFIKKYMNCTLTEYLYAVRLNHVRQDLLNTALPIGEIFEENGCTNYHLAMKLFRERWGCTPRELRKREDVSALTLGHETIPPTVPLYEYQEQQDS